MRGKRTLVPFYFNFSTHIGRITTKIIIITKYFHDKLSAGLKRMYSSNCQSMLRFTNVKILQANKHVLNMCLHDGSESLDSDGCSRVRGIERGNNWINSSFVFQRKMESNSTIALSKT